MSRSLLLIELLLPPDSAADQPLISLVSDVGEGFGKGHGEGRAADLVARSATGLGIQR